ncbi:MAG: recombinase family protein [Clostridia bacterium]|nr:recombinase family protein [Clostridia bacterium]
MKEKSKNIKFCFPVYDSISEDLTNITALYLRVSTDMQAQEGYGLDFQFDAIRKYVQAFNIPNPVIFVDDGYTGMNIDRPAFQEMNRLMNLGRVKFVITYSLDRIGRTQMIILKFLKEQCEKCHCDFFAVKDNIDSRSKQTYGILISILSIFAEFDHDAIVAKLSLGRQQRAMDGLWKGGGIAPVGYKYSKETNTLEVIPEDAIRVKKVFEMYNTNEYSPRLIAEALGFSSDVVVFNILKNRTYIGEITFRGEQYKGIHQRIIEDDVFFKAQDILQSRSVTRQCSNYLLSSIVYCGVCNAKMRYMKWGKGKNQQLKLLCYSKYGSSSPHMKLDPNCTNDIYDAHIVEEYVVQALLDFAVQYSDDIKKNNISVDEIATKLTEEYEKLDAQYQRVIKAYTVLGDEDLLKQAQEIQNNMRRLGREIETAKEKKEVSVSIEDRINLIRTLPDMWAEMTAKQRQNVVRELVEKVVITNGHIDIYLYKSKYNDLSFMKNDD